MALPSRRTRSAPDGGDETTSVRHMSGDKLGLAVGRERREFLTAPTSLTIDLSLILLIYPFQPCHLNFTETASSTFYGPGNLADKVC